MSYFVTVRYRSGPPTVRRELPDWSAINEYVRGLAVALRRPFPTSTVMTVEHGPAKQRFSVRGGGKTSVSLIKLTDRVHAAPAPVQV